MAKAQRRKRPTTHPELFHLIPAEFIDAAQKGDLAVLPGADPNKPVMQWVEGPKKGQFAKGTGQYPASANGTPHKRQLRNTKEFQRLFDMAVAADLDPNRRGSIGWWVAQLENAAEGGEQDLQFDCDHCGKRNYVQAWKKPDVRAAEVILDRIVPKQPTETHTTLEALIEQINVEVPLTQIEVFRKGTKERREIDLTVEE